ncbi:hypothetical protein NQ176_g1132 [Zarea fungicola]|uniref:Uncharacterized protein n=1 Tax=Zarea fungicola TaxID=93591 RepID=A0ACC1NWX3_9HYPO|nr:hypothetical protein NQ176_g1132 [Lecanicillium fungicola]
MSDPHGATISEETTNLAYDASEVAFSSYNPALLGHLRQPVPRDLPSNLDPGVFTFQDAFEDLLIVSRGSQMLDINSRYQQSRLLRQMYPNGEPTWLWLRRLQSQGLISQLQRPRTTISRDSNWIEFKRALEEGTEIFWGGIRDGVDDDKNREAVTKVGTVFRELHNKISRDADNSASESRDIVNKQDEAENSDDLFSAIKSNYSDGPGQWDGFKKALNETVQRRIEALERQVERQFSDSKPATISDNGINLNKNEKETRSEYVDVFGYKHTTIKRKIYDEIGNEVGSSTSIIVKPAEESDQTITEDGNKKTNDPGSALKSSKHNGWFW